MERDRVKEKNEREEFIADIKIISRDKLQQKALHFYDVARYSHNQHLDNLNKVVTFEEQIDSFESRTLKAEAKVLKLQKELAELNEEFPQGYFNKKQIAHYCGVSERTVAEWVAQRMLKYTSPNGGKQLFKLTDVDSMMERLATQDRY